MGKLTGGILLLFASYSALAADDKIPAAQELLNSAGQRTNLFHGRGSPFELDVSFTAQIRVPVQGHLTLKWQAQDRWWRNIVAGDFVQTDVRMGDRLYTSRNLGFTPIRIHELIGLVEFGTTFDNLRVKKEKQRSEDGVDLLCFRVEGGKTTKNPEVCLNSVSDDIASYDWQEPPDERRTERYSDYFDFEGHRFPRKLQLLVNGIDDVTVNVDRLTTTVFDDSLLVPPKGSIERRQCAGMQHAIPVKTADPAYPKSASQNKMMGDTTVAMTILEDGTVGDIQLIGRATQSMDDATLQTLKGWKFKPAMCGTEPVVSDIQVEVSFRLD